MLVDVSLGLSLESWIRESGHDAVFVREIDPRLSDSAILQQAQQEDRILSEILERHAARLQGSFAVYQNGHLRIRQPTSPSAVGVPRSPPSPFRNSAPPRRSHSASPPLAWD